MGRYSVRFASVVLTSCLAFSAFSMPLTSVVIADQTSNVVVTSDESREKIYDFVERLYSVCLGRKAEKEGKEYWADELLERRATGVSCAMGFIFSDEFMNKNCTNDEYVKYMYDAFFGRTPANEEVDYWVSEMDSGKSRTDIFTGFANSPEFAAICEDYGVVRGDYLPPYDINQTIQVNLFIDRMYTNVLDRTCDAPGMTYWTQELLEKRLTGAGVAQGFIFSEEFINRNLCNEHYIKVLYKAFMGREFDQAGLDYWVGVLDDGDPRENAFNGYVASPEFTAICDSYGILRGEPGAQGNTVMNEDSDCSFCVKEVTTTPTAKPTSKPTSKPTAAPTAKPTAKPTSKPTAVPTAKPTAKPTSKPTAKPTTKPTSKPTVVPTATPTIKPTATPVPTTYNVGDVVLLGYYGKDAISWIIIDKDGDNYLLLSEFAIDNQQWNTTYDAVTWDKCTLRTWLNDYFYNTAFLPKYQDLILTTKVKNEGTYVNRYGSFVDIPAADTEDKLFLLSFDEADKLPLEQAECQATYYASQNGCVTYRQNNYACNWWIRDPGSIGGCAGTVMDTEYDLGDRFSGGYNVNDFAGVRPAMWVNLSGINIDKNKPYDETHRIGDTITMGYCGGYVDWKVVDRSVNNDYVLVSEKVILSFPFNKSETASFSWVDSDLRDELNTNFYGLGFTKEEASKVIKTRIQTEVDGGYEYSEDNLYILDAIEVMEYFPTEGSRRCYPTENVVLAGCMVDAYYGTCPWWVRNPGSNYSIPGTVDASGYFGMGELPTNYEIGVRPAMRIHLD